MHRLRGRRHLLEELLLLHEDVGLHEVLKLRSRVHVEAGIMLLGRHLNSINSNLAVSNSKVRHKCHPINPFDPVTPTLIITNKDIVLRRLRPVYLF